MRVMENVGIDFDDVFLLPKSGKINSRSEVNLMRKIKPLHGKYSWEGFPVIVANVDSVGTFKVATSVNKHQMSVALHKFYPKEDLITFFRENPNNFYTLGIRDGDIEKLSQVSKEIEIKFICLDVPNAYIPKVLKQLDLVRKLCPDSLLMVGNLVTGSLVEKLVLSHGVDICKINIGTGSHCLTTKKTGIYYPSFSCCVECADSAHQSNAYICVDGGLKEPGDFAKAFCAGADFSMAAGIFMGTEESGLDENWEILPTGQKARLKTYGMSSDHAQIKYYGKKENHRASEGLVTYTDYKGPISSVIEDLTASLKSTGSYIGAKELKHFPRCATFIRKGK